MKAILSGLCSALMVIFSASSAYAITTETSTENINDTRRGTLDTNKRDLKVSGGIKYISRHGRTRNVDETRKGTITTNETIGSRGKVLGVKRTGNVTTTRKISNSRSHIRVFD